MSVKCVLYGGWSWVVADYEVYNPGKDLCSSSGEWMCADALGCVAFNEQCSCKRNILNGRNVFSPLSCIVLQSILGGRNASIFACNIRWCPA